MKITECMFCAFVSVRNGIILIFPAASCNRGARKGAERIINGLIKLVPTLSKLLENYLVWLLPHHRKVPETEKGFRTARNMKICGVSASLTHVGARYHTTRAISAKINCFMKRSAICSSLFFANFKKNLGVRIAVCSQYPNTSVITS